jgi:hypothetical protein
VKRKSKKKATANADSGRREMGGAVRRRGRFVKRKSKK